MSPALRPHRWKVILYNTFNDAVHEAVSRRHAGNSVNFVFRFSEDAYPIAIQEAVGR